MDDNIQVKMESETNGDSRADTTPDAGIAQLKIEQLPDNTSTPIKTSRSPSISAMPSPAIKNQKQETVGGDITVKMEPGQAPKLSRKQSRKIPSRPPQLFSHLPDATAEATSSFDVLSTCTYGAKYLGYTEPPLECDCSEEWGRS